MKDKRKKEKLIWCDLERDESQFVLYRNKLDYFSMGDFNLTLQINKVNLFSCSKD